MFVTVALAPRQCHEAKFENSSLRGLLNCGEKRTVLRCGLVSMISTSPGAQWIDCGKL